MHCNLDYVLEMSVFTAFGRIAEIKLMDKGYRRVTVAVNIPFMTKWMKFNVWNEKLLKKKTLEPFTEGEDVKVKYNYKDVFLNLIEMEPSMIDNCPICYSSLEAIDAQRMECEGCSLIPENERKTRINVEMKLTSCTFKQYLHSVGYKLEFLFEDETKRFVGVIFENTLLYNNIPELKVGSNYFVVGWKSNSGILLDIVDLY